MNKITHIIIVLRLTLQTRATRFLILFFLSWHSRAPIFYFYFFSVVFAYVIEVMQQNPCHNNASGGFYHYSARARARALNYPTSIRQMLATVPGHEPFRQTHTVVVIIIIIIIVVTTRYSTYNVCIIISSCAGALPRVHCIRTT